MKVWFKFLFAFILFIEGLSSCTLFSGKETKTVPPGVGILPESDRKYVLKSVIIKLKSSKQILGSDIETTIYIDDYGDKYCNKTETKLKYKNTIISTSSVSITKNDFTFIYNPEKKTGTKSKNKGNFNPMHIDFAQMDRQSLESNGITKEGEVELLGRMCEVYVMENIALEMSGRYEVWNKIPLKFHTKIGDSEMEMYAFEVQENPEIPEAVFEQPKNIEFIDVTNPLASPSEQSPSDSLPSLPYGGK